MQRRLGLFLGTKERIGQQLPDASPVTIPEVSAGHISAPCGSPIVSKVADKALRFTAYENIDDRNGETVKKRVDNNCPGSIHVLLSTTEMTLKSSKLCYCKKTIDDNCPRSCAVIYHRNGVKLFKTYFDHVIYDR